MAQTYENVEVLAQNQRNVYGGPASVNVATPKRKFREPSTDASHSEHLPSGQSKEDEMYEDVEMYSQDTPEHENEYDSIRVSI